MHLVTEQATKNLTRYGSDIVVFFKEGDENKFLKKVIEDGEVDWDALFGGAKMTDFVFYDGGSTAFGCDETIVYYIWSEIQEASEAQIEYIRGSHDIDGKEVDVWPGGTYRELQKLNGRTVYQWGDLKDLEDWASVLALISVSALFL